MSYRKTHKGSLNNIAVQTWRAWHDTIGGHPAHRHYNGGNEILPTKKQLARISLGKKDYAADFDFEKGLVQHAWIILEEKENFTPLAVHWANFKDKEIGIAVEESQFCVLKNGKQHETFSRWRNSRYAGYLIVKPVLSECEIHQIETKLVEQERKKEEAMPVKRGKGRLEIINTPNTYAIAKHDDGSQPQVLGWVLYHHHGNFKAFSVKEWADERLGRFGIAHDTRTHEFFVLQGKEEHSKFMGMPQANYYHYLVVAKPDEKEVVAALNGRRLC